MTPPIERGTYRLKRFVKEGESMAPSQKVSRGSLADVAFERLLEQIMAGALPAGAPLKLAQLADSLGISQTPLRESLARLEGQGLVVRHPMRGFAVAQPLTAEEHDMLMVARMALEPEIAADAAVHRADEVIAELRANVEASAVIEIGPSFDGYRGYLDLSAQFHELVSEACRNRFLRDALAFLPIHVQRFRLFGQEGVTDRDVSIREHRAIADAVIAGDQEGARRAMADHVAGVATRSREAIVAG